MSATATIPVSKHQVVAFRWVLPIAEILVCALLLWPWRGFLAWQLRATGHDYGPTKIQEPLHFNLPVTTLAETPRETRLVELADIRLSAPAVLNLPCSMLGLLRREAVPRGMLPEFWRSLSWPFFGIVFWWIAGRGIDAIIASRHGSLSPAITLMEVFVAALIILLGSVFWGLAFGDPNDRSGLVFPWPSALAASGLWILLGGAIITARIVQWRIRVRSVTGAG